MIINEKQECPYCKRRLTPIIEIWIPRLNKYVCHWCKIKFITEDRTKNKGILRKKKKNVI